MGAAVITIALALVVFWLVAHVSILLGVVAGLVVLAIGFSGPGLVGRGRGL